MHSQRQNCWGRHARASGQFLIEWSKDKTRGLLESLSPLWERVFPEMKRVATRWEARTIVYLPTAESTQNWFHVHPCHLYPFPWRSSYILEVVALRAALSFRSLFCQELGSRWWWDATQVHTWWWFEREEKSAVFQPFFFPLYFCRPLLFSRALFLVTWPSGQNLNPGSYIPWLLLSTLHKNIQLL